MTSDAKAELAVQERHSPKSICFGCGPANDHGLHIRSFEREGAGPDGAPRKELHATWTAQPHHQAFPGMLNGGITGALLDCHSNWMAAMHLMRAQGLAEPPCTVTADFAVKLKRPTPVDGSSGSPRACMMWYAAAQLLWQSSSAPMMPPLSMPVKASCQGEGVQRATHSSPATKLLMRRPCSLAGPQPKQRFLGA